MAWAFTASLYLSVHIRTLCRVVLSRGGMQRIHFFFKAKSFVSQLVVIPLGMKASQFLIYKIFSSSSYGSQPTSLPRSHKLTLKIRKPVGCLGLVLAKQGKKLPRCPLLPLRDRNASLPLPWAGISDVSENADQAISSSPSSLLTLISSICGSPYHVPVCPTFFPSLYDITRGSQHHYRFTQGKT